MKKYFITAVAALSLSGLFTSCTHDIDDSGSSVDIATNAQESYEQAFLNTFGRPAEGFDWGFGTGAAGTRGTRSNPGETYAQTSTGINANANEWADAADAPHGHGGWVVPDPLTEEQKAVVAAYFQTVKDLKYEDPHFRHFFVQQVYKGGNSTVRNTTEGIAAADNNTYYTSTNMNLLTVGYNEQHINNFNGGTYSGSGNNTYEGAVNQDGTVNVLDNGYTVNDFAEHHHPDQIMLMVNIDDTECMGYHNTGCSLQKNDKAALVGWETIRTWANANGLNGDCLDDKWNRSFVGFDLELYSLEQSYLKDGSGNNVYAKMSDGQNGGLQYVWDGKNVTAKGVEGVPDLEITDRFTKVWKEGESKQPNDDGTITYHAVQWGGLVAELKTEIDFSKYESLVIEFAEATTAKVQWYIEYGSEWGSWNSSSTYDTESGVTKFELNFGQKYMSNLDHIYTLALQAHADVDIKISRIYLKGREGESGFGNYLMVDGKKVPYLITNTNMYGGVMYGGKDEALNDSEMKITVEGKECFNMVKIKELVDAGYLPVKDKNLRTWVKWQGGDGYFSDWIVTLTEAQRTTDTPTTPVTPPVTPITNKVRVIAEDLTTLDGKADFDFNDVVFDVDLLSNNQVRITLLAAGGTLPLTVGDQGQQESGDYEPTMEMQKDSQGQDMESVMKYEVHRLFKVATTTMVNTNAAGGANRDAVEVIIDNPSTSSDIHEIANAIPIRVYKKGTWIELEKAVPVGTRSDKLTASKVAVDGTFQWCAERVSINKDSRYQYSDYKGTQKSRFELYLDGKLGAKWWDQSTVATD